MQYHSVVLFIFYLALQPVLSWASPSIEKPLYHIEIILFQEKAAPLPRYFLSKDSLPLQNSKAFKVLNFSKPSSASPSLYTQLPQNKFSLQQEAKKISTHQGYRIIAHLAWIQPLPSKDVIATYTLQKHSWETPQVQYFILKATKRHQFFDITLKFPKYDAESTLPMLNFFKSTLEKVDYIDYQRRLRQKQLNYIDSGNLGILLWIKKATTL